MKYRPEIDGLRAVAVVPVVLFHAGFELFSGGFVGVDVFFVISGYLITTLLIEDIENSEFSIVKFYERRARRILPALFLVLIVSIPFAWAWMLPSQMKDFSRTLLAVTFFVSNIRFAGDGGYFDAAAEENPLLHTWSLAVEEQYYVIFPVLLFLAWRFGKNQVFWIIVFVSVLSFILSEWGWRNQPSENFYLAPSRAWELLAGSIAAFVVQNRGVQANSVLSFVGLAAILASIFGYDESIAFPSFFALIPVCGVVLLILFAKQNTLCARILSNKVCVGVGAISYSAYLWHQPLFSFARMRLENTDGVMLALCAISFVAAALSWKFVEEPFRRNVSLSRRHFIILMAVVGSIICMFGLLISETDVFEKKFEANLSENLRDLVLLTDFAQSNNPDFVQKWNYGKCFYGSELNSFSVYDKENCLRVDPSRKNVLLLGDSHAAHWAFALKSVFPEANILQANASGCRPLLKTGNKKRCTELRDFVFNVFLPRGSVDTIILSARWKENEVDEQLKNTITFLQQYSENLHVIGPTIEYIDSLPLLYIKRLRFSDSADMRRVGLQTDIDQWVKRKNVALSRKMASIVAETSANFISVVDLVCPDSRCLSLTPEGSLMNFDAHHFTLEGADYLVQSMKNTGVLTIE